MGGDPEKRDQKGLSSHRKCSWEVRLNTPALECGQVGEWTYKQGTEGPGSILGIQLGSILSRSSYGVGTARKKEVKGKSDKLDRKSLGVDLSCIWKKD